VVSDITEDTTLISNKRHCAKGKGEGTSVATNKVKLIVKAYNTRTTKKRKTTKAVKQLM
jgi:hypothetical protein